MPLTADEYMRAWERVETHSSFLNSRLVPGTCVLETLSMVVSPDLRYVFVDDFGYATSYCRSRLREDLTPPDERGSGESMDRWRRMRSAFTLAELADSWAAANAAFSELLDMYIAEGYSRALGDRLREIVNAHGLDLELGEIYVLPQDIHAMLAQMGNPSAWWDEGVNRLEDARGVFNFADAQHRAALERWLRKANKTA